MSESKGDNNDGDRRKIMAQAKNADLTSNEINMSFAKWSTADNAAWICKACTYLNDNPRHLTCSACGTMRETNRREASTCSQVAPCVSRNDELQDVAEEAHIYDDNESHQRINQKYSNETDYESKIIEERLQEHVAIQQEMLDEIQREREENDRKMKELQIYQQRILDKLAREKAEREKISNSNTFPEHQDKNNGSIQNEPTKITISQAIEEKQVVEDYRRHLMEQKSTLEESFRHIHSISGLVKLKGSVKTVSLLRGSMDDINQNDKEDKNDTCCIIRFENTKVIL